MNHELIISINNLEDLKQAISNGIDGVILNLEINNNLFSNDDVLYSIRLSHLYGVKVYADMAYYVKDVDVVKYLTYVEFLYKSGIDGVYIKDFGVLMLCRNKYTNLYIIGVSDNNVLSKSTSSFFKSLGINRVVLSDKLSFKEISFDKTEIDKELKIHGKINPSFSSLFDNLFSSKLSLEKNNQIIKNNKYLLNMKELNLSYKFKDIIDSNIKYLKIDGTFKSSQYIGFITSFYKRLLVNNMQNINIDRENYKLKLLYNNGYSNGYYFNDDDLLEIDTINNYGNLLGKIIEVNQGNIKIKLDHELTINDIVYFNKEEKELKIEQLFNDKGELVNFVSGGEFCYIKTDIDLSRGDKVFKIYDYKLNQDLNNLLARQIAVTFNIKLYSNLPIEIQISDTVNTLLLKGRVLNYSQNFIGESEIRKEVEKLIGTPFVSISTVIDSDGSCDINIDDINMIRKDIVNALIEKRMSVNKEIIINNIDLEIIDTDRKSGISVFPYNVDQLDFLATQAIDKYYIFKEKNYDLRRMDNKYYYRIPITNKNFMDLKKNKNLVGDYFDFKELDYIIGDYHLGVFNIYTAYYLFKYGINCLTLHPSLSFDEIINLINNYINVFKKYPCFDVISYGVYDKLILKGNIFDIVANDFKYELVNENNKYPIYFDGENTHILTNEKIVMSNEYKKLLSKFVTLRYDFYNEEVLEIKKIISL